LDNIATNNKHFLSKYLDKNAVVFGFLWLLTFAIYLPAAKAGWVIDSAGWLYNIRNMKFLDYINNTQSVNIPSLYQFTQLVTYVFYKLFNANPYAWHTLMVTMHAVNAWLLFIVCSTLFRNSGIRNNRSITLWGAILFTVCPHISEVIVWESAFHYLQGLMLILLILWCTQRFIHGHQKKYALIAAVIYFCSTYSLEIFYITPWLVLSFAAYYHYALSYDKSTLRKTLLWFFVPQLLMFGLHLLVLLFVYGRVAHIGENVWQPFSNYACKLPRYIFHILFLGRYFPNPVRQQVYVFIGHNMSLIVFYNLFVLLCIHIASRFFTMTSKGKTMVLLFTWIVISTTILLPLTFPTILLVVYDRYTYFLDAFTYMLLALAASYLTQKYILGFLLAAYSCINLFFTIKVNLYWKHSAYIVNRLLKEIPDPGNRIIVLLNLPQSLNGIPMIGAERDGQYKKMHELFVGKIPNKIYDVAAFNMLTKEDGAHVIVANDSIVRVTLNQWGTWWWYEAQGGISYENEDYILYMRDMGHWYDIQLKHPRDQYLLLYAVGDKWKEVNWKKKEEKQY
jgi:hypothetical protein